MKIGFMQNRIKKGKYKTGNRKQETGDRRQETGDRRQETGDRRQENFSGFNLTFSIQHLNSIILNNFEGSFYCTCRFKIFI